MWEFETGKIFNRFGVMKMEEPYQGFTIRIRVEKIRAEPPMYRAVASVLHPLTGKPVTGAELKKRGMPASGNGPVTKQAEAPTRERASILVREKYAQLVAKVMPVLRTDADAQNTLRTLYMSQAPTWPDWSKNADVYIRNYLLPQLGDRPLATIDRDTLHAAMSQRLKKEEKGKTNAAELNRHLTYVRALFEHFTRSGYYTAENTPACGLELLRRKTVSRSRTMRQSRSSLSQSERTALFTWVSQHSADWRALLVMLMYNIRHIDEICALDESSRTKVQVDGVCFDTVWITKKMVKKDVKYAANSDIPPQHLRRLPVLASTKQALDAYAATLDNPPDDRPLLGKGPHGTVRILPNEASAALAGLLRELGISALVQSDAPSTDAALVRLLELDAAECAASVMCLRNNERALLLGQTCSSTDAAHYWDPDCDETMLKLWLAGRRLALAPAGTPAGEKETLTIPADGVLKYRCPGAEGGRLQIQLQADQDVTVRVDTVLGHFLQGG